MPCGVGESDRVKDKTMTEHIGGWESVGLDSGLIWHGDDGQRRIVLGRHDMRLARKLGDALESDAH